DVIVVRKLGVPYQPELGMGAVGEDGIRVINREIVRAAEVSAAELAAVEARERAEVARRARRYRAGRPRIPPDGRVAVVGDDGIATGSTARAACRIARALGAARVVLAVPVAPPGWPDRIGPAADEMISVATPTAFRAIGQFYADFSQTSDEEVTACLTRPPGDAGASDELGRRVRPRGEREARPPGHPAAGGLRGRRAGRPGPAPPAGLPKAVTQPPRRPT